MAEPAPRTEAGGRDWRSELERAADVLGAARSVALACHVNPDPDAIGSMLGLAVLLERRGKDVVCSWANHPFSRPRWLDVLDGAGLIVEPQAFPAAPEVMVALDTAAPDRLGSLAANARRAGEVVVLDHHRTNPGFGTIVVLDPAASSTAELVFRLIERMGGDLPDESAAALLFEDNSVGFLRVLGPALDRLVHDEEASVVWTYVTQSDLAEAGLPMADTDDLIDVIRTAREADVACVLKQQRDGRFKVSLRSRGATDVGGAAAAFGGGGHRLAAGYTSETGLEETVQSLLEAIAAGRTSG